MKENKLKKRIIEQYEDYFGRDFIVGKKTFKETLSEVLENYYNDNKTDWDNVECTEELDTFAIVVKSLLEVL